MAIVKLRAFEIVNQDLKKEVSDIGDKLKDRLKNSKEVNDRRMRLNAEDPQKEEDLIPDFSINNNKRDPVFCTMLRVALGNNVQHVSHSLFKRKNFTISELNSSEVDAEAIYKNHYYFSLNNNFLVTNLPGNTTITRLQTYINWLLESLYEITPIVSEEVLPELSNIKDIVVKDTIINPTVEDKSSDANQSIIKRSLALGKVAVEMMKEVLSDAANLSDIELEQMVSAKLVIELKKPRKSDSVAIKKAYSALLKPVADLDNYEFVTRNNKKIVKGKKLLRIKEVNIETTGSGMLNEAQLSQEMNKLILELENENKKAFS